jgi:hypothetical protein
MYRINKYNKQSSSIPKSSENFVWKDTNWKKVELRLSILQNKIYAAKKDQNIQKVRKLQRLILNSYDFKKLAVSRLLVLVLSLIRLLIYNSLHAVCHDTKKKNKLIFWSCAKRNSFPSIAWGAVCDESRMHGFGESLAVVR